MSRYLSEQGYYVRGVGNDLSGNQALDTAACRDLVNNLNHLQDMQMQFGAQCGVASGSYMQQSEILPGEAATSLTPLLGLPPMPMWLHQQTDGSSARIVVRIVAKVSAAGTATFRVAIRQLDRTGTRTASPGTGDATSVDLTCSSTTAVTLQGVVYVPLLTDDWALEMPTRNAYDNRARVKPFIGVLEVWAQASDKTSYPRVEMITVRENMAAT